MSNIEKTYLVGDTNGTFISKEDGVKTTSDLNKAQVFNTIGDAMRACVEYNKNAVTFKVIPIG